MADIVAPGAAQLGDLDQLYPRSFPSEDLMPLVTKLRAAPEAHHRVAMDAGQVIGHVTVCACGLDGKHSVIALLGPLAVDPDHQRQGVGAALIAEAKRVAEALHAARLVVLGDPAYYGRHGFTQEMGVQVPYTLPESWLTAWQSVVFDTTVDCIGTLTVPAPWQDATLWS